jgi:hypothetical protein
VACFSNQSTAKDKSYQNEELILAVEEYRMRPPGRPWLFPIRFDEVDLPEFNLGAGKTLNDLQRTDLFGAKREPELARLSISISRVIGLPTTPAEATSKPVVPGIPHLKTESTTTLGSDNEEADKQRNGEQGHDGASVLARLKVLLRDPARDIELDDYVMEVADVTRQECVDTVTFPTSSDAMRTPVTAAHFVIRRAEQYYDRVNSLAEILAVGCAWGSTDGQDALWSRAMRIIANTTPMASGHTSLLDLRAYPRIIALYAAGLGAIARNRYSALRAVAVSAKYRGPEQARPVPVVAVCNTALPFRNAPFLASVVAMNSEQGHIADGDIEALSKGTGAVKLTPVSDDLHSRLRETLRPVIRDDDDYSETFDKLEVLLGVIAEDAAIQERTSGGYLLSGWVGRYAWHTPYNTDAFMQAAEEFSNQQSSCAPLNAGLFDGSPDRVNAAFSAMQQKVERVRFRVF